MSADVEALYPNMDIQHDSNPLNNSSPASIGKTMIKINFLLWAMEFTLTKGYISFKNMIFSTN